MVDRPRDLQIFKDALQRGGLTGGLAWLNERVVHRYTAAFRFTGLSMRPVGLYDKAGDPIPDAFDEIPIGDSFCQFVMREGQFRTGNTSLDERLNGHAYQGVLLSYHGVPLLDNTGQLFGTLCHFDFSAQPMSDDEFEFFQKAALLMPPHLIWGSRQCVAKNKNCVPPSEALNDASLQPMLIRPDVPEISNQAELRKF